MSMNAGPGNATQRTLTNRWSVGKSAFGIYRRFARSSPLGGISAVVLLTLGLMAVFADFLAPANPLVTDPHAINAPPSISHVLGADRIGRDVLSRVIHGSRITLLVAFASIFLGDSAGFVWGTISGYLGGRLDLLSQRLLDILLSFPTIILALLLLAVLGAGLVTVIIAIAVVNMPRSTRVVRSTVLSVKEMPYVEAARAMGVSPMRIMARHVAPQCIAPMMVLFSVGLGGAVFAESALSFLGVGVPPPAPSWGNMLGGALADVFKPPWWLIMYPGLAIVITIMAFNLVGDGLRDHLDPRLRGRL